MITADSLDGVDSEGSCGVGQPAILDGERDWGLLFSVNFVDGDPGTFYGVIANITFLSSCGVDEAASGSERLVAKTF